MTLSYITEVTVISITFLYSIAINNLKTEMKKLVPFAMISKDKILGNNQSTEISVY